MKVVAINVLEDCFDGSFRKEIVLEQTITPEFIRYLGQVGTLQYFPHFARPFFRLDAQGFMLKGIQNNTYMHLLIIDPTKEAELLTLIHNYI